MLTLADAILQENTQAVMRALQYQDVNAIDEYGFTPLIEAAIVDHVELSELLLKSGANPNQTDVTGGTALQWAAENNNLKLCQLLLSHHADPNSYNLAGQPVLVMPILRRQTPLKNYLLEQGASRQFAEDYISTKLLGHLFELVGTTNILDTQKHFVEVDFEGFYLEVTLGLVSDSLHQFQNHFAARQLKRYAGISQYIVQILDRASHLIKYQQYRVNIKKYIDQIHSLIQHEPVIIPVGYEGHAITFIKFGDIWVKCDRREDSRLYDNVMFYRIQNKDAITAEFLKNLIYVKQTSEFINHELDDILGLSPMTELKIDAQISGNCTWANTEATVPALFFLILMQMDRDSQTISYYKTHALNFFNKWREWNKDRSLNHLIQDFHDSHAIRKASKAEILAAILFQRAGSTQLSDQERIKKIIYVFKDSSYRYILKNYLRVYFYEANTEEGKQFSALLEEYDLLEKP